jgi:hypothetical protein
MSIESATYVSQLVATNPLHTDPLGQADSHIRLIKSVLQQTLPNLNAAVNGTPTQLNNAAGAFTNSPQEMDLLPVTGSGQVALKNTGTNGTAGGLTVAINDATNANPKNALTLSQAGALAALASVNAPSIQKAGNELLPTGVICMCSGSIATIPAGWALCNGANGTPNLQDMFIVGAGNSYAAAQTGGATSQQNVATTTAGSHNHTGAVTTAGAHNHGGGVGLYALQIGDIPVHTHPVYDPGHAHTETVGSISVPGGPNNVLVIGSNASGVYTGAATTGIVVGNVGNGNAHNHTISIDGAHTHGIVLDGTHSHTVSVATVPPFYALAFIMKL